MKIRELATVLFLDTISYNWYLQLHVIIIDSLSVYVSWECVINTIYFAVCIVQYPIMDAIYRVGLQMSGYQQYINEIVCPSRPYI